MGKRFRKKPIVIDAEQFFPGRRPWPQGIKRTLPTSSGEDYYYIRTLEGEYRVTPGDWIITGIKGEKYPCKPDIFDQTYEPVEDE